jgi:parallel beta-helix repeat protein
MNKGDGIRINSDSVARNNTCDSNGSGDGAGIHASGSENRIESNNLTEQDRGIDVDGAGNLIIKNSAANNTTNYELAANNVFGAIVNRNIPGSPAVSGSSAASSAGTTDPWANFSY